MELKIMVTQIVNHVRNDSVNRSITIQDTEKIETNKTKKTDTKKKSKYGYRAVGVSLASFC